MKNRKKHYWQKSKEEKTMDERIVEAMYDAYAGCGADIADAIGHEPNWQDTMEACCGLDAVRHDTEEDVLEAYENLSYTKKVKLWKEAVH